MPVEVAIHQSDALRAHCADRYGVADRWRAAERVAAVFEDTWQRIDLDESLEVTVVRTPIPAPIEEGIDTPVATDPDDPSAPDPPCPDDGAIEFESLLHWWEAYAECHDSVATAADSNLLLTDTDESAGGRAYAFGPPYAVAQSGRFCAQAPDPSMYRRRPLYLGRGAAYSALSTAIHEIGHNLIGYGDHHHMGTVRERRFTLSPDRPLTISPMSSSYYYIPLVADDDGTNYCGTSNADVVGQIDRYDPTYDTCFSPCAVAHMEAFGGVAADWTTDDAIAADRSGPGEETATAEETSHEPTTAATRDAEPPLRADGAPSGEPDSTAAAGALPREPDVRIVDAAATAAPTEISIRSARSDPGGPATSVATVDPPASPAPGRSSYVETIGRLEGEDSGRYEVTVRRGDATATAPLDLGPAGARPEETIEIRVRPDGSLRVATAVTCRR